MGPDEAGSSKEEDEQLYLTQLMLAQEAGMLPPQSSQQQHLGRSRSNGSQMTQFAATSAQLHGERHSFPMQQRFQTQQEHWTQQAFERSSAPSNPSLRQQQQQQAFRRQLGSGNTGLDMLNAEAMLPANDGSWAPVALPPPPPRQSDPGGAAAAGLDLVHQHHQMLQRMASFGGVLQQQFTPQRTFRVSRASDLGDLGEDGPTLARTSNMGLVVEVPEGSVQMGSVTPVIGRSSGSRGGSSVDLSPLQLADRTSPSDSLRYLGRSLYADQGSSSDAVQYFSRSSSAADRSSTASQQSVSSFASSYSHVGGAGPMGNSGVEFKELSPKQVDGHAFMPAAPFSPMQPQMASELSDEAAILLAVSRDGNDAYVNQLVAQLQEQGVVQSKEELVQSLSQLLAQLLVAK